MYLWCYTVRGWSLPGMKALAAAPTSRGARMVFSRDLSRGPGAIWTAPCPLPKMRDRTKGIVKMPTRLLPTVRSRAIAVLPPMACTLTSCQPRSCAIQFSNLHSPTKSPGECLSLVANLDLDTFCEKVAGPQSAALWPQWDDRSFQLCHLILWRFYMHSDSNLQSKKFICLSKLLTHEKCCWPNYAANTQYHRWFDVRPAFGVTSKGVPGSRRLQRRGW